MSDREIERKEVSIEVQKHETSSCKKKKNSSQKINILEAQTKNRQASARCKVFGGRPFASLVTLHVAPWPLISRVYFCIYFIWD